MFTGPGPGYDCVMSLLSPERPAARVDDFATPRIESEASHTKKLLVWSLLVLACLGIWMVLIVSAITLVT